MFRGIYTGTSAMLVQSTAVDVAANNLANVGTSGFRGRRAVNKAFPSVLMSRIEAADRKEDPPLFRLGGKIPIGDAALTTVLSETALRTSSGALSVTGNPFDVAPGQEGYFVVADGGGNVFYTRSGHFARDGEGRLVTHDGYVVQGDGGPIELGEAEKVVIGDGGQVSADGEIVGNLRFVLFENPTWLRHVGKSLVAETDESGAPQDLDEFRLVPGALEMSNVHVVEEMVRMIDAHRAYEASAKCVTTQDETITRLTTAFGRSG
ncbi:MAG: flagellar hook-basal body protein [Synergistaceae bacterium]|nr:flagellar hook-basal body protein [Synergistaceae bacterium]